MCMSGESLLDRDLGVEVAEEPAEGPEEEHDEDTTVAGLLSPLALGDEEEEEGF